MEVRKRTIFLAIFSGDIPLHRLYIVKKKAIELNGPPMRPSCYHDAWWRCYLCFGDGLPITTLRMAKDYLCLPCDDDYVLINDASFFLPE